MLFSTDPTSSNTNKPVSHTAFAVRVLIALGLTAALVLILWLLGRALDVFLVLFAAILFGVFLSNTSRLLHKFLKLTYPVALAAVVILLFGIIIGGSYLLAPSLVKQGQELGQSFPSALQNLQNQVRQLPFGEQIMQGMPGPDDMQESSSKVINKVLGAFSTTLGAIANLFIIIVIGIYLAANPRSMAEGVVKLVPIPKRNRAREVLYTIGLTLWGWIKGTLLSMIIIGTVTTICLSLIGIPMALILGIIAGLFEFVPNIGPFIAGLPAVLLGLMEGQAKALWVIGLFVAVQTLEGWVLTPMVQKRVIDLPPVLTLSAQLLLGMLAGFLGLILAVPLMGVLMVLVKMLYIEDVLGDKNIEVKGENQAKQIIHHQK